MLELIAIIVIIVVVLTYVLTIPYRRLGKYGGSVMPPPPPSEINARRADNGCSESRRRCWRGKSADAQCHQK